MLVLGINLSHDRSAALLRDGEVLVAIAEERLDRAKHSLGLMYREDGYIGKRLLPFRSIQYCLSAAKLSLDDLDLVVVDHAMGPVDLQEVSRQLPLKNSRKIISLPHPSHHLCHAYSSFFASEFDESAIFVTDYVGSLLSEGKKESESIFLGSGRDIRFLERRTNQGRDLDGGAESPANFYRLVTLLLGFSSPLVDLGQQGNWIIQYDEAGKTMGLAPYGNPRPDWVDWVWAHPETGQPQYINFREWLEINGFLMPGQWKKRDSQEFLEFSKLKVCQRGEALSQLHRDLAYKAQKELEKALLIWANRTFELTGLRKLCLGGGIALNSVANQKILKESPFKEIFIQPAATDDGNALGAAYYGYFKILGGKKRKPIRNVNFGKTYPPDEIARALEAFSLFRVKKFKDIPDLCETVSELLARGKIIGWFQDGSEFGPRALGNRSILADPRNPDMKNILNSRVKFREEFRPYAPAVLLEHVADYFEKINVSPFMLLVGQVKKGKQNEIPAVTHVDGSARVQTVTSQENPQFYELLQAFYRQTDTPILLNTSFNTRGEPIVESPEDAIRCFFNCDMDYLVLGKVLLAKELYQDEELIHLFPRARFCPHQDEGLDPSFYIWEGEPQRFELISSLQRELLQASDGSRSVEEIISPLPVPPEKLLEEFRVLLRKAWIQLFLSRQ